MDPDKEKLREAWQRATDADLYRAWRQEGEYAPDAREVIQAEIQRRNLGSEDGEAAGLVIREMSDERSRLKVWMRRVPLLFSAYWVFVIVLIVGVKSLSTDGWPAVWALAAFLALVTFILTYVGLFRIGQLIHVTPSRAEVALVACLWWAFALSWCVPGLFGFFGLLLNAHLIWRYVVYRRKARAALSSAETESSRAWPDSTIQ